LPIYNAEAALLRSVAEFDREIIDDIVLVDDAEKMPEATDAHLR
jgi:hypothetical protein